MSPELRAALDAIGPKPSQVDYFPSMEGNNAYCRSLAVHYKAQRDALLVALRDLVQNEGLEAYRYLDKGIGTKSEAGKRWLGAREAVAKCGDTP